MVEFLTVSVIAGLRQLKLPWSHSTEEYTRATLLSQACIAEDDAGWESSLLAYLTQKYHQAVLPPEQGCTALVVHPC